MSLTGHCAVVNARALCKILHGYLNEAEHGLVPGLAAGSRPRLEISAFFFPFCQSAAGSPGVIR